MKKRTMMIIALNACITTVSLIKAIEPVTVVFTSAAGLVVKGAADKFKDYWFRSEEEDKRLLKKCLNSRHHHSVVAEGCNENFGENCHLYSDILRKAIEYNFDRYEKLCMMYQKDNQALQEEENNELQQSFFETLPQEEQSSILKIQRNLVIEYCNPQDYKEELVTLHAAINTTIKD